MDIVYVTVNQPLLVCPLLVVLDITPFNHIFLLKYHNLHLDIYDSFLPKCTEMHLSLLYSQVLYREYILPEGQCYH